MASRDGVLKMLWPITAVGGLFALAGLAGIWAVSRQQEELAHLVRRDAARVQAAEALQVRLRQLRFHSVMFAADPFPARWAVLADDRREVDAALAIARHDSDDPDDLLLLDRIEAGRREYDAGLGIDAGAAARGGRDLIRWADEHPVRELVALCGQLADGQRDRMVQGLGRAEGQARWAGRALLACGLVGAVGGVVGGSAVAREVSRRLLRAEQLAAVGQLAAGVSHEVRNPLTGIKLLVEAAIRPDHPAPLTDDDLRLIHGEIGRLERTVQGLLDFARTAPPDRRRHDLRVLVTEAVAVTAGRAAAKGVAVSADPSPYPLPGDVDRDQLLGLLTNLLANAIEASPPGGAVRVQAAADGRKIRVAVSDAGPGIAPAMLANLFTPFATDKPAGTGLGLVVARRAARDHGGDLQAENRPGGGAQFILTLPAAESADANPAGGG